MAYSPLLERKPIIFLSSRERLQYNCAVMANLILSDCFGVIMNEIAVDWFNEHFDDPKIAMTLKEKYFNDCDLGDVSLDEVFESIGKDLGYDPKELKDDWYRRIHLRQDVFDYITSLRRGDDKLVLLSNAGFPFMGEIIDRFGFEDRFDKIFVSGAYHMMKPDPEFYKLAINSYSEKFDHIYMIDDNPKNLAPVSALGIEPILYTDLDSLKAVFH